MSEEISLAKILLLAREPDQYALEASAGNPLVKLNPLNFRRTFLPPNSVTHPSLKDYAVNRFFF